jgi:hypothetical protein
MPKWNGRLAFWQKERIVVLPRFPLRVGFGRYVVG